MAKEKLNIVIDGITYKNIDVYNSNGKYNISTTGITQIIKQYIKNKYGDIKVWGKSRSYAGGSSVDIYLWGVPKNWHEDVINFAERFGQYNDSNYGGWRGRKIGAFTTDGDDVDNFSPMMFVYNQPPYGAKEQDMTPPNYEEKPKPQKKEFQKKGAKFSPTDNLDLILDCGNGWKIYVGKPKEKYLYSCVKDESTKPIRDRWAEIKSDMLEIGFQWNWKNGTFQRWSTNPDDSFPQMACDVLSKYWESSSQPKEDSENIVLFRQGQRIVLVEDDLRVTNLKKGMKGTILYDIYEGMDYSDVVFDDLGESRLVRTNIIKKIENEEVPNEEPKEVLPFYLGDIVYLKMPFLYNNVLWGHGYKGKINSIDYGDEIAYVDFLDNEDNSRKIPVPFSYLEKYVNNEETPREFTGKIPLVKIIDVWGDFGKINREFTNYDDLEKEFAQMEVPESGYDKYKFKFVWADGSFIIDRIDLGKSGSDFNPMIKTFQQYVKELYDTNMEQISVMYEYEMKEPMSKYSTDFENKNEQVDLDTYISDLNMLLEMEEDADKRIELSIYINDLNTLKLLD